MGATTQGYARAGTWRPLPPSEIANARAECAEQHRKNKPVFKPTDGYWCRPGAG